MLTIRLILVTKCYTVRITLDFIQKKCLAQSDADSSESDLIFLPPKKCGKLRFSIIIDGNDYYPGFYAADSTHQYSVSETQSLIEFLKLSL